MSVHPDTIKEAKRLSYNINHIKPGQIRKHVEELLTCGSAARAVRILDKLGALSVFFPEVAAMKGVQQPKEFHPEGDVFVHTLFCLSTLEKEKNNNFILMLSALMHDIGKPPAFSESDRIRFNKHESIGAAIAANIANRIALSEIEADIVDYLIRNHMKFKSVKEMRKNRLKNFVLDDTFPMLLALVHADCVASHGNLSDYKFAKKAREDFLKNVSPSPLLRGQDLIELGLSPSPEFGFILRKVESKRKDIKTKSEALSFVKKYYQL
ncbi:MAG: HD domain-containing protein [Planctomycetota bacterium]